ncbi:hypothetical protein DXB41_13595 [Segatella copri]|uniref:Uncharacterized protein n=1 Tax=Segatella copri TaxID=165179 RepID=A0A3E5DT63_9BACT|nr:hypothetical protein DXB41_13595 [Segatella copri]RGS11897.1 hypothetical protein DWY11_13510 [Segatella copri]
MHISCYACAYQLLCKRTTAVVRPKILTVSITYPISSNNKKRVNHKLMTHPHFLYELLLSTFSFALWFLSSMSHDSIVLFVRHSPCIMKVLHV